MRYALIPIVDGDIIVRRDGTVQVLEDEVGTREAARLIGCSRRHIQQMCDEGRLVEVRDWRKVFGGRGGYRIRRAAVMALRFGDGERAGSATAGH